uniref:Uncharacterized protein n=1 Tax=Heterorhabditis bacteriophora TaxID=37862 RepID=A0A1I7WJV7_HETBA
MVKYIYIYIYIYIYNFLKVIPNIYSQIFKGQIISTKLSYFY